LANQKALDAGTGHIVVYKFDGNYSAKKQKVAKKRLDRVFLKNFKIST